MSFKYLTLIKGSIFVNILNKSKNNISFSFAQSCSKVCTPLGESAFFFYFFLLVLSWI